MFLNLVVLVAPFQARTQYVLKLAKGDSALCGAWVLFPNPTTHRYINSLTLILCYQVAYMSAGAGLAEFFLNPILGRLSDRIGRKAFLIMSPLVNLILKLMVYFTNGRSLLWVALDRIVAGAATTVGGSTTCLASLSDVLSGDELAGAVGNLGSYAGLGVLLAPLISGNLLATTQKVRHVFLFGALVAAFQLVYNLLFFEETLEEKKRKPMDWSRCNPFSFLKIFTGEKA